MLSVNRVGKVIEHAYGADGLTIACQVRRPYPFGSEGLLNMFFSGWQSRGTDSSSRSFPPPPPEIFWATFFEQER
jgi:hypothetical protein